MKTSTAHAPAVKNALAAVLHDIQLADTEGRLPAKFAGKLRMRLRQHNRPGIERLRREVRDEGWDLHVFDEGSAAEPWVEAYVLCIRATAALTL